MTKKPIATITLLVVLALILWGASRFMKPVATETVATNPCAIDVNAIILPDPEGTLKTDKQVVQAMFDHYFSYYLNKSECPDTALKGAKLTSIGTITHDVPNHMLADIIFELQPESLDATKWITSETSTTSTGFIKNKKGVLSIRTASSTNYLVI